jgi:protein arginine kinase activator
MLCNVCGQKEATVHLTEIVNDKVKKLHLCEGCAREKAQEMEEHFGLGELLAGLTEFGEDVTASKETAKLKCSNCGLTYAQFRKRGRLGCSDCYDAFKTQLAPLLKRIHGSDHHAGQVPAKTVKKAAAPSRLEVLRERMRKAVEAEEFEEAARMRDEIRKLEKKKKKTK